MTSIENGEGNLTMDNYNGKLIVIEDANELAKLLEWRDNNKDLVRAFRPMIQEGIIQFVDGETYRQEFKTLGEDNYRHEYLAGGFLKGFGFDYNSKTMRASNVRGMLSFYPVDLAIQDMITVHATCMTVLQHATQFVQVLENKLVIKVT